MESISKRCLCCGVHKHPDEFGKNKQNPDGKHTWCRACVSASNKRYRDANKEKVAAKNKAWAEKNREKRAASVAAYRVRHPERIVAQRRQDRAARAARFGTANLSSLRWARNNRDKAREINLRSRRRRRARKAGSTGNFTEAEFQAKLVRYQGRCHWCHEVIQGRPHRDHLIALSRGGSDDISNIVPSCGPCNHRKTHLMPWEFMSGRLL